MASPPPNKRICVGKIASTHGVKGLVKIIPYCDDLSLLKGPLYTSENPADNASLTITLKNSTGKYILASIEGITTPEDAKKLKCSLFVSRETLPNIEGEDTFYIEDLVGRSVGHLRFDSVGFDLLYSEPLDALSLGTGTCEGRP